MTPLNALRRWVVAPYGNAVANGEPESEWDWMVFQYDSDGEQIEVESRNRAEQIAALLNAVEADPEIDAAGLRKAADLNLVQQEMPAGWAHAGRIAEAYETKPETWQVSPNAQQATAAIACHICGVGVGISCVEKANVPDFYEGELGRLGRDVERDVKPCSCVCHATGNADNHAHLCCANRTSAEPPLRYVPPPAQPRGTERIEKLWNPKKESGK